MTQAGFATDIPWTGYAENNNLEIPVFIPRPGESASARYHGASPGYFEALGTPLLSGREIDAHDTLHVPGEPGAVVINQSLARRYFADRDPVGRALSSRWTIVGVIEDIPDHPADVAAVPAYWMALEQRPFGTIRAVVRTKSDALSPVTAIRAAITSLDPELAMANVTTMESTRRMPWLNDASRYGGAGHSLCWGSC